MKFALRALSFKEHLFSLTQHDLIESIKLPSHISYMFRLVVRPSSDMSTEEYVQQDAIQNEGVPSYIYCLRMT